ncbi:MAG: hypothetical protein AAGF24_14920 [Cyanobacteria bacterium P01_H01_bin.121]
MTDRPNGQFPNAQLNERLQEREMQNRLRELVARRQSLDQQISKTTRLEVNAIKSRISALYAILTEAEYEMIIQDLISHLQAVNHWSDEPSEELTYSQVSSGLVVLNHTRRTEHPERPNPQPCLG